jgi:hypothetical protein
MQDLRPASDIPAAAAGLSALPAMRDASPRGERRAKEHGGRPVEDDAILHALFSLRDDVSEDQFKVAFEAFVAHLIEAGFARGSRLMRRKPLQGFGAKLPGFTYYAAIEFPDLEREQACYDYVAAGGEPVRAVHRPMNSLVQEGSGHFFVSADI